MLNKSDDELREFFKYELAPIPLSLFSLEGMRKTAKAALYGIFQAESDCNINLKSENCICVVDGGFLLHRVVWQQRATFAIICQSYVKYFLETHFGSNAVIVFDGYQNTNISTKRMERQRRNTKKKCADIMFDKNTLVSTSQEKFLSNESNRMQLIDMLQKTLTESGYRVEQALDDADNLVVDTALSIFSKDQNVVVFRYELNGTISERFWCFSNPKKTDANALSECILKELNSVLGENKEKLIAQTYDGANVMRGQHGGVNVIVKKIY